VLLSFPSTAGGPFQLRTIAVANQKGGCGKTTIAVNLCAALSFLGKKVLLVDLDPQGHASLALGVRTEDVPHTLYDVFDEARDRCLGIRDVLVRIMSNLDLVPSEIVLTAVEQKLAGVPERENKLLEKFEGLEGEYDFVVIDCPPNLGLLTFNALRAARELIVPVESSIYSLHGLGKLFETVGLLREVLNHQISVRVVMNDFDGRSKFSRGLRETLEKRLSGQLFKTLIRHSVRLREAACLGKSVLEYDRHGAVACDFQALASEVIEAPGLPLSLDSAGVFSSLRPDDWRRQAPAKSSSPLDEEATAHPVLLTIRAPAARYVQVAGDFNQWVPEPLIPPIKEGGIWRKLYHLKPGIYRYKFIIDGEWTCDHQNPHSEANPFGGSDSILQVGEGEPIHAGS
jgi:chromosome partitioning protein